MAKAATDMATMDNDESEWYWGETSKDHVNKRLSGASDGTFLVFKSTTGRSDELTLAVREHGSTKYKDILFRDHIYGFTEPLGFETLGDVLDAYNWSPQTKQALQYAAARPTDVDGGGVNHSRHSGMDALSLLKSVRETAKLKGEKEEELELLHLQMKHKDEDLEELKNSVDAYLQLSRMMELQITRHQDLSRKITSSSPDNAEAFSENYQLLTSRKTEITKERQDKEDATQEAHEDKSALSKEYSRCYKEVEHLDKELQETKSVILIEYPELSEFLTCLLWEDPLNLKETPILDISNNEAKQMLMKLGECEGAFIVRNSRKNSDMPFIICVRFENTVLSFPVLKVDGYYGFDKTTCIFEDIHDLVRSYTQIPFRVHNAKYGELTLRESSFDE